MPTTKDHVIWVDGAPAKVLDEVACHEGFRLVNVVTGNGEPWVALIDPLRRNIGAGEDAKAAFKMAKGAPYLKVGQDKFVKKFEKEAAAHV